jgi:hypothetical protein
METNFQINQMRKKETGKKMSLINEKKTHEFFPPRHNNFYNL